MSKWKLIFDINAIGVFAIPAQNYVLYPLLINQINSSCDELRHVFLRKLMGDMFSSGTFLISAEILVKYSLNLIVDRLSEAEKDGLGDFL